MKIKVLISMLCILGGFLGAGVSFTAGSELLVAPRIRAVRVAAVINPIIADFIVTSLEQAQQEGMEAFLLELDTPGGLDGAMRTLIQALLGSDMPVIVYVSPQGGRAASAGALIALAADFIAMAPGTNIGAAHPVAIGVGSGQSEVMRSKLVEDAAAYAQSIALQRGRNRALAEAMVRESLSLTAEDAVNRKLADVLAANVQSLLVALDGAEYRREEQRLTLRTRGAKLVFSEMSWRQHVLNAISQPSVAYMLLMLGLLGLLIEISQPGGILPGAVGSIALLLAFFSFQTLPVNYVGVLFIFLALVLFALEIKVVSYGMLTLGGIVSMTLGSLMLMEHSAPFLRISLTVIAGTVAVVGGLFLIILFFVTKTQRRPFVSGVEGMIGKQGEALTEIHQTGRVFVHGEYWTAYSSLPIDCGERVEVVSVRDNLRLEVKRVVS